MNDKERAQAAEAWAKKIAGFLMNRGFAVDTPFESGNVDGGWIVEAERRWDDFTLNVEVTPGPWEDDGTYDE